MKQMLHSVSVSVLIVYGVISNLLLAHDIIWVFPLLSKLSKTLVWDIVMRSFQNCEFSLMLGFLV